MRDITDGLIHKETNGIIDKNGLEAVRKTDDSWRTDYTMDRYEILQRTI